MDCGVQGTKSGSHGDRKDAVQHTASLTKPVTAETELRLASAAKLSLDERMAPYWVDPDIKDDRWT